MTLATEIEKLQSADAVDMHTVYASIVQREFAGKALLSDAHTLAEILRETGRSVSDFRNDVQALKNYNEAEQRFRAAGDMDDIQLAIVQAVADRWTANERVKESQAAYASLLTAGIDAGYRAMTFESARSGLLEARAKVEALIDLPKVPKLPRAGMAEATFGELFLKVRGMLSGKGDAVAVAVEVAADPDFTIGLDDAHLAALVKIYA